MPAQDTNWLNKSVSELISEDTYVAEDGSVIGTLNYVENWTEFSSNEEEQSGHFFPFTLTQEGTSMSLIKDGVVTKENIAFDKDLVLSVDDNETTWEVTVDGTSAIKLSFADTKLN